MKAAGIGVQHVIKLLHVANNDLQSIEQKCQDLRKPNKINFSKSILLCICIEITLDKTDEEKLKTLNKTELDEVDRAFDVNALRVLAARYLLRDSSNTIVES
jgi:ribonucleotide reductase alpha subunit